METNELPWEWNFFIAMGVFPVESHNWIKSCILIGLRSEVFSVELQVESEA